MRLTKGLGFPSFRSAAADRKDGALEFIAELPEEFFAA